MKNKRVVIKPALSWWNQKKHGNRVSCIGKCGRMVLVNQQECRKCRRARRLLGKRRVERISRSAANSKQQPFFETSKQKYDRVKKES